MVILESNFQAIYVLPPPTLEMGLEYLPGWVSVVTKSLVESLFLKKSPSPKKISYGLKYTK